jgi:hypothetical protein
MQATANPVTANDLIKLCKSTVEQASCSNPIEYFTNQKWSIQQVAFFNEILYDIARNPNATPRTRDASYFVLAQLLLRSENLRKAAQVFLENSLNNQDYRAKLTYALISLNILETCDQTWVNVHLISSNDKIVLEKPDIEAYYKRISSEFQNSSIEIEEASTST